MLPLAAGALPRVTGGRPVLWAATGRSGGVSRAPFDGLNLAGYVGDDPDDVAENRRLLAAHFGLPASRLALMDAVHGDEVAEVVDGGVVAGVDVLVTDRPDLVIVALGADCVPLALVGDDGCTIAVAHCGWRGLVVGAVGAAVGTVRERGADIALAVLGPSVCGACYPVPPARAEEVRTAVPRAVADAALVTCADGQPGIDVREGVAAQLVSLGVPVGAIERAGGCTVTDPGLFSYRRDGLTGRQGIAVCRPSVGRMDA